ncbi:hypothetical protein QFC19_004744 [Naganishia cerealis]|uniref:Uncharacterized protein n=1 Tax=Naganishia cerealis TaxID=610337 RepID=A0ACC2VU64_9TREE|nr:hypothetical protein QFC19_004744 [Naganishia cerealis]
MEGSERVVLDVDFAGYVKATTYITIRPTNARLSTVLLHAASNIRITSCKLQGPEKYDPLPEVPATYIHHDPFEQLQPPGESSANIIQSHPEIKRRIWSAMSEKEEGELEIDVSHGWVRIAKARSEDTHTQMRLAEIMITIEYEIVMSELDTEGFVFRRPGDSGFDEGSFNSARHWVPCLDNLWDRCPWELEIIVPRTLAQEVETGDERDEGGAIQELPVTVIASAELEEQVIHPEDSTKAIFYFAQSALSSAQQISFAIGPFSLYVIRADNETKRIMDGEDITESLVLAYCLPGMELQLQNTTSWMRKAMDFFEEYDVYPYTSFKMVFVEDPAIESALSAGMAVFSQSLLYPPEILEQAYVTRPILSFALASQWSGLSIIPKAYSDSWLVDGIALYLNAQLTRKLLGDNEYRYRLRCDIERCVTMDQGDQYPICVPGTLGPVDRPTLQFIHLKAPLVLHILDKRMGKLGTTSALARSVIPEIFRQARADSLAGRQLATEHFFRICKKTTRSLDVIAFQNQWVLGSGCPRFAVRAEYVKRMGKQGYLNLSVYQPPSQAFRVISDKEVNNLEWKAPTEYFTGDLTVHVYDGDEAPFEHIVDVVAEGRIYELPYTANPKRVYRNRSSRRTGRIKAEESQNGAVVNDTEMSEERREALEWKFMNWSQDDMEKLFAQGFDWIRYDPDVEWIAIFERQKDAPGAAHLESNAIVWATQLQSEKDVIAQKEAIDNLCATPLPICSTILTRTVLDDSYFYRIRMHAAESLLRFHLTVDDCSSIGFFHLQKVYRSRYCKASTEELDHLIASIPDPSDLPELMLRQVILRGLCLHPGLELNEGIRKMRDHLVQLLIYDVAPNSPFSLVFYKTALVASLAAVMRKQTPPQRTAVGFQTAVSVLDRILVMDRLMPSYGNLISIAGLQAKLVVALSDRTLLPHNIPFFLAYIRQGNEPALRRTAYDCVLACQPPAQWLVKHIRMLLKRDPSLDFRRHIAQGLADSWLMAFAFGEMDGLHDPTATDKTREMLQRDPDAFLDGDIAHMRQAMSTSEDLRRVISSLIVYVAIRLVSFEVKLVLKVGASAKTKNAAASKSRTSASVKANLREDSANINKKKKKTHKALANGLSEEVFKAGKIIVDRLVSRCDAPRGTRPD